MAPAGACESIRIEEPFHGAILNRRHGEQIEGGLKTGVSGHAPIRDRVAVNGITARRAGSSFSSEIILRQKKQRSPPRQKVTPADTNIVCGYCGIGILSLDIGSRLMITASFCVTYAQKKYASLFDCFYLKNLRELHSKYGTRFVLNIYYTTGDGFELPQFPDLYKSEWQNNSDWLKLAFHAYANLPNRPYQYASPEQLIADLDKVAEQIIRFAGEQTYSPPTVIHWGMVQPTALKPLCERGVRVLSGYCRQSNGIWDINYMLDDARSEYLSRHDAMVDFASGIVFSKIDIVCNEVPVERIVPTLQPLTKDRNCAEIMDLFTHEQYFWPFYSNYLPDHFQRLEVAIRWVTEQGYKPVFYHEGFLGGPV